MTKKAIAKTIRVPGKVVPVSGIPSFVPDNRYNWNNALKIYADRDVLVTIGPPNKLSTTPQKRYLFGGPYKAIAEFTGATVPDIHTEMKRMFLGRRVDGCLIPEIPSVVDLTTVEFIKYYKDIINFAAEFFVDEEGRGLYIAEPNEQEMWSIKESIDAHQKRTERYGKA
jgi:hypothetical protein